MLSRGVAISRRAGIAAKHDIRIGWILAAFLAVSLTIYARLIVLEIRDGADYRAVAAEPLLRTHAIAGMRGRILARDGTVLAYDQPVVALALQYHWLEEPVNPRWLRAQARSRLSVSQRKDRSRVAAEEQRILDQRQQLWKELAELCGLDDSQWQLRRERIQKRVEAIASSVNARRDADKKHALSSQESESNSADEVGVVSLVKRSILEALFAVDNSATDSRMTIVEELSEHVVFEGLSLEAVAQIEAQPQRYPGVKLIHSFRRSYPQGELAAHLVGYLGATDDAEIDDWTGRAGIERQYDQLLRSHRGVTTDRVDLRGKVVASTTVSEPRDGQDLVLTLDPVLQRSAQSLLDQAVARRLPSGDEQLDRAGGGAVVAIDVHSGAILAAASAPRFNPNGFVQVDNASIEKWLSDPSRPLFDRAVQMALPPGSVFKIVTAAALLSAGVNPLAPVDCQGYLHQPETLRCAVFRRYGVGHGPVTLTDALARSCNVYFFHHAEQIGAAPLVDWARRLGLGQTTGIDLPGEAAGKLPSSPTDGKPNSNDFDPRQLSIGQGPMTATPLQIAQAVAAIANGGNLVAPHVARQFARPPRPISALNADMIAVIRKGLRQAVADDEGTAHATVDLNDIAIAGKTGTAEVGGNKPDHAWFAGYAPADGPQVAFVVVIEHAGNAAISAAPVAQHLVRRMSDEGYFARATAGGSGGNGRARVLK